MRHVRVAESYFRDIAGIFGGVMVEQSAPGPIKKRRRSSDGKEDHRAEGLGQSLPQSWIEQVRTALGSWYEESQRDLPWRNRDDPYAILVSEMMLVQTTVSAVIPYFERFLSQFPDPQTLANAPETEVLKAWEGLGYYRRARQLQAAARMIVERHQGQLPRDASAVRALPGVGGTWRERSCLLLSIFPSRSWRRTPSEFWRGFLPGQRI